MMAYTDGSRLPDMNTQKLTCVPGCPCVCRLQARIVAMTCTHAALTRRKLVELGFKFDNLVMEEAAQILEVGQAYIDTDRQL